MSRRNTATSGGAFGRGKMKLVTVHYLGFTAMDRRFSNSMLPWIVSEIRKRDCYERVSLGMEDGYLQAYNSDFELQFCHNVLNMSRFSQADIDPCTFLYLLRDDTEQLLYCYLFQAIKASDVNDLYQQMKEHQANTHHPVAPARSLSNAASLTSLSVDISPSSSNFIEVLYIGKIKVWNKKVPDTFIDDALEKFKVHDQERRSKLHGSTETLKGHNGILRRGSCDAEGLRIHGDSGEDRELPSVLIRSSTISGISCRATKSPSEIEFQKNLIKNVSEDGRKDSVVSESDIQESPEEVCDNVSPNTLSRIKRVKFKTRSFSESSTGAVADSGNSNGATGSTQNLATNYSSDSESSAGKYLINVDDHNRTMVLQVGRIDLRLISPDRKLVLLHKQNKDISTCIQGQTNNAHFGFICREGNAVNTYIGYVFKCESQSVAGEAVGAITQALSNADSKLARSVITSCEHCPMVWYHKLCVEIENLTDRKTQGAILRRLDQLDDEEQSTILTKFRGAETDSLREQNEFLMMLLRAHCEMKQGRHVHDTAENRSEFLNQYLGGSTIFTKAKRTLTNSFDNLLKRKASRDDLASSIRDMSLPINNRENSPTSPGDCSDRDSDGFRSRSSTVGSASDLKEAKLTIKDKSKQNSISPDRNFQSDKTLKSPIMDIFFKVGSSPKSSNNLNDSNKPSNLDSGSWRQAIFKRVAAPNPSELKPKRKRSKEELRHLWQKSIHQAILLVRMEKENDSIKAKQEENAVKRIKLEYDDMKAGQKDGIEVWELITNKNARANLKTDNRLLLQAIRQGVPRGKRGDVWYFLAELYCGSKLLPFTVSKFPNYDVPYEKLLKQLTSHQHAILIDLGRTFPSHSYYSSPLGPGQLALFNLLKAYSLLDPEVGYCQGLSFVAGVLLLHLEESHAFVLLRHLMFWRGLRYQYLPDMTALQVKLYQLSRLLRDQLPDLYLHFDLYEIAPTLYAAPWMLTLFASQFPLGFVARVFDLIFLENTNVVFRVALALLTFHKDALLKCDNFEEIMNYLKIKLPSIDKNIMDKVMKQVCTTEISKQLNEYKVEYQVLQEELASIQPQLEHVEKLEMQNKKLADQNKALTAQLELALSNVQRLEKSRTLQQSNVNRLEMHNRGLDVTVSTLATFVNSLIEQKIDVEIPDDVRRILAQITFSERRKTELKNPQNNLLNMFNNNKKVDDKIMVKSLSTGKINLGEQLKVEDGSQIRSNSLSNQAAMETAQKTKSLITSNERSTGSTGSLNNNGVVKTSHFFSSSHSQILQQQKEQAGGNFVMSGPKIDITVEDYMSEQHHQNKSSSDCTGIRKSGGFDERSVSLPLNKKMPGYSNEASPTNSIDSGVGTPSSPKEIGTEPHPLSNCDVQFTFNGTRELKHIKGVRNNNSNNNNIVYRSSSPDVLAK